MLFLSLFSIGDISTIYFYADGSGSGADLSPSTYTLQGEFRSGSSGAGGAYEYTSQYSTTAGSTRSQPSAGWMNTLSNRSTTSKRSSGTAGSQGEN